MFLTRFGNLIRDSLYFCKFFERKFPTTQKISLWTKEDGTVFSLLKHTLEPADS